MNGYGGRRARETVRTDEGERILQELEASLGARVSDVQKEAFFNIPVATAQGIARCNPQAGTKKNGNGSIKLYSFSLSFSVSLFLESI